MVRYVQSMVSFVQYTPSLSWAWATPATIARRRMIYCLPSWNELPLFGYM